MVWARIVFAVDLTAALHCTARLSASLRFCAAFAASSSSRLFFAFASRSSLSRFAAAAAPTCSLAAVPDAREVGAGDGVPGFAVGLGCRAMADGAASPGAAAAGEDEDPLAVPGACAAALPNRPAATPPLLASLLVSTLAAPVLPNLIPPAEAAGCDAGFCPKS